MASSDLFALALLGGVVAVFFLAKTTAQDLTDESSAEPGFDPGALPREDEEFSSGLFAELKGQQLTPFEAVIRAKYHNARLSARTGVAKVRAVVPTDEQDKFGASTRDFDFTEELTVTLPPQGNLDIEFHHDDVNLRALGYDVEFLFDGVHVGGSKLSESP
jgi:hypothetical protein